MTGKEIVLRAMNFEETPCLPVAVLDGYVWILRQNGLSFKDMFDLDDCGAGIVEKAFDDFRSDM